MSDQHSPLWEIARLEPRQSDQSLTKNACRPRSTAPAAVLPLDRKFLYRAAIALPVAVAAEALVAETAGALHLGALATCIALTVAVLGSVCPLAWHAV